MTQEELHKHMTFGLCTYKTGTGTRGRGHWDACVGTWGGETRDLGTSSMGRGDVWDGDAGRQIQGRGGRRDVNEYLSQISLSS